MSPTLGNVSQRSQRLVSSATGNQEQVSGRSGTSRSLVPVSRVLMNRTSNRPHSEAAAKGNQSQALDAMGQSNVPKSLSNTTVNRMANRSHSAAPDKGYQQVLAKVVPVPLPKPVSNTVLNQRANRPPSEVADKDDTVQNWLNEQPTSPSSVPSITQGPTTAVRQSKQQRTAVKRLFTSPAKLSRGSLPSSANRPRATLGCKKIPFKRGRGSGASSSAVSNSPRSNWRKRLPSISVRTTISPSKQNHSELIENVDPNILIEVTTTAEKSPGKWSVVTYRNEIGSPATSGRWEVEEEQNEDSQDAILITSDDAEELAEPLNNLNDNGKQPPLPLNRKRTSNIQRGNSPKVRMVCREDERPEFYVEEEEEEEDNPDGDNVIENPTGPGNNQNQDEDLVVTTPPTNAQRKRMDRPRANTRKRLVNKSQWKLSVARKGFNDGTEYTTSRGTIKKARAIKPPCSKKCNRCQRVITPEERQDIFENFWALDDLSKKRDFISRLIDEHVPSTCSTSPECAKKSIRRYHFVIEDEEVRVCKTMFLNTLGIPDVWVETTLKKITPTGLKGDARGRHKNRPVRIPEATLQSVRDHILLFPRVHSHYTRERSKREYLETNVHSVIRMHKLYLEWAKENNIEKAATLATYRRIFNTEFNLGFFLPKKDQCLTCTKWKSSQPDERRRMVDQYAEHLENKRKVKALKIKDKDSASELKCVACFDLQKVLTCPRTEVSISFYLTKLSLYNLTVFDLRLTEGHCYLWTECDAGKGSNEIGSNLLSFIEKKIDDGVKEFVFYSDNPTGQNKNRMLYSMYVHASIKYNIKITHRYLESGHSYSEADSMHARIEDEAKIKQEIYTPEEWATLIKSAKQDDHPYIVNFLRNEEVLDLHTLVKIEDWDTDSKKNKVFWSKVREISTDSNFPNYIFYRYNFNDEPSKILIKLKQGGTMDHKTYRYPSAYTARFPLPQNKKTDIRKLMDKRAIPSLYHAQFEEYLSI